jgi:hypothetical protein
MIACGHMKVNVEVPADSDLDENNCDESGGELIVVIIALLRMF